MNATDAASATAGKWSVQTRFEGSGFPLSVHKRTRARSSRTARGERFPRAASGPRPGLSDLASDLRRDPARHSRPPGRRTSGDRRSWRRRSGSHPPSLRRVLLFLAGVGVLDEVGPRRFALTPMGVALRTGVPGSLRPAVLLLLDESHWRPWGHLLHTVRTGETAFHHAHGAGLFDYLAGHPEVASVFNAAHERQLARPRAPRRRDVRLLPR